MSASSLHLVALTLQRSNLVNQAVYGTFSSRKEAEIVVSRGSDLELLRPDSREGTLRSVSVVDTYSVVRSLAAFRLTGASRDYVVVGADSGKITVLEFDDDAAAFKPVHVEAFGKTGCRRIVPGQYLAVDPHSPPEFRANIVRNLDEFHEVFGTEPGDGLWLEPSDRVRIW